MVVVSVVAVVRVEHRRGTATTGTGLLQASGAAAAAEFRSQYVVYAELQRSLGRAVQTAAGSGLHSVVVAVLAGRTGLVDRLVAPAAAAILQAVQFHRLHGRDGLCAHGLLQTAVGRHHHRVRRVR